MLTRNIQFYLHSDNIKQQEMESLVAGTIAAQYKANMTAFQQVMPAIYSMMLGYQPQQYSVFCDASATLNVVDISTGQVFYRHNALEESNAEVEQFLQGAPAVSFLEGCESQIKPLNDKADVVVMFGLGLGHQLLSLLKRLDSAHLIIYEPSADLLSCSLQVVDWHKIFTVAAENHTTIYLQVSADGSSLPSDLAELKQNIAFNELLLYRHYSHPLMDNVWAYLQQHSGDVKQLLNQGALFTPFEEQFDLVPPRHADPLGNQSIELVTEPSELYCQNMAALENFYPEVSNVIKQHKAMRWQLVRDEKDQLNLHHKSRKALFYNALKAESTRFIEHFEEQPFRDDVLVGHRPGQKLRTYLHNRQVTKILPILERNLQQNYQLESSIDSLIIFGTSLGNHIETLLERHDVQHLYICEPNLDFFYASLYSTNWAEIFANAEKKQQHIYLNLGGDGSQYFYDLMAQFDQVGAFAIANTYMLSSYFNPRMQEAISELKENLKVILAISEHYDNVRYGIAHTYSVLKQQAQVLKPVSIASEAMEQLPVFVVGNGPSLDKCFEYLHEYKDRCIIISCGTALKALYQQGICPDFHAEVEQNRSTFNWVNKVNDSDYLKKINLLTVNGVHPDTAALFKQTYLCFKEGESSTSLFIHSLKQLDLIFATLSFAYPTVSNMALSMALTWRAKTIYLFGVDLGFTDVKYHHSKHSAYYKADGKEIYDYQAAHGGGIPVKGNFLPVVYTKTEFSVARKVMQESIKYLSKGTDVYNCSNGALLSGAVPLDPEHILIKPIAEPKETLLNQFLLHAFSPIEEKHCDAIVEQMNFKKLATSLDNWLEFIDDFGEIVEPQQAKQFIQQQWDFVRKTRAEPGDPTYLLLHGSTTYFSSVMLKLVTRQNIEGESNLSEFKRVLEVWREYLSLVKTEYIDHALEPDTVGL